MAAPMSPLTELVAEAAGPLGADEERRAVDAALGALRGRRLQVYGAELRVDKRRGEPPLRRISVGLADLAGYLPYEVLVDERGEVVEVQEQPELVPPFSGREVAEAAVLARAHPELAEVADRWGVATAAFYPTAHDHDHPGPAGRRRVGLHYLDVRDPDAVRPVASAVVDLIGGGVESVAHH